MLADTEKSYENPSMNKISKWDEILICGTQSTAHDIKFHHAKHLIKMRFNGLFFVFL
jgi:hypothetical protein